MEVSPLERLSESQRRPVGCSRASPKRMLQQRFAIVSTYTARKASKTHKGQNERRRKRPRWEEKKNFWRQDLMILYAAGSLGPLVMSDSYGDDADSQTSGWLLNHYCVVQFSLSHLCCPAGFFFQVFLFYVIGSALYDCVTSGFNETLKPGIIVTIVTTVALHMDNEENVTTPVGCVCDRFHRKADLLILLDHCCNFAPVSLFVHLHRSSLLSLLNLIVILSVSLFQLPENPDGHHGIASASHSAPWVQQVGILRVKHL